jgi:hypothetical protein
MISIEVDTVSYNGLREDLKRFGEGARLAIKRAVDFTGLRVETIAKERLKGLRGSLKHWITGRLASSVHYETKDKNSFKPGRYSEGQDGKLDETVTNELECIVGTNVVYGPKIEFEYDSYLGYAAQEGEKILIERIEKELNSIK